MRLTVRLLILVICFGTLVSFSPLANAQDSSGVALSPSLIEEGANPGQVLERTIGIRNISDEESTYYLFTKDISGVRDGGAPIFSSTSEEKTGYELTEWITLGLTEVTLLPGREQKIPITISVPESASPGSHFGGVFVSKEPPRLRASGAGVGYQVANIISIRISGDAIENAQIRSLSTDKLIYSNTEVKFQARLENKGNVIVRPVGPLEIYNMLGSKVATVIFNESQNGVFPQSIRDFELIWTDEGLGFGRYEGVLSLVYGQQGSARSTITSTVTFWILPLKIIKPALIVLGILLIGTYIGIRLYVRRTISRMSGGRRLVRRQQNRGPSTLLLVAIVMLVVTVIFLLLLLAMFA